MRTVLSFGALLTILFIHESSAQICPILFAFIGPCLALQCPDPAVCFNGCCCQKVTTTTTRRRTNEALIGSSCTDQIRECAWKKQFCNKPGYEVFMTEKCPKTCNRCPKNNDGNSTDIETDSSHTNEGPNGSEFGGNGFGNGNWYGSGTGYEYGGGGSNYMNNNYNN